jgi:hypothetical protein
VRMILNHLQHFLRSTYLSLHWIPINLGIGKGIYRLGYLFFSQRLKSIGKLSLYLKGGMARQDIIPALSDIDILIIFSGTSANTIVERIKKLKNNYFFKIFPILGEIEIIPRELYLYLESRQKYTSLTHSPIKDRKGIIHSKAHPERIAIVTEAVFDYAFHFMCRLDHSKPTLESLKRASKKILRHFPDFKISLSDDYQEIYLTILNFMEDITAAHIIEFKPEETPEAFQLKESLGPMMTPYHGLTFEVCSPESSSNIRGSMGHPPIFAKKNLRTFLYHYFDREKMSALSDKDRNVLRELEFIKTGIQCLGQSLNSYNSRDHGLRQLSFFRMSASHFIRMRFGEDVADDFLKTIPLDVNSRKSPEELDVITKEIISQFEKLNSSR